MRVVPHGVAALAATSLFSLLAVGCGESSHPTTPAAIAVAPGNVQFDRAGNDAGGDQNGQGDALRVNMKDACDPATFNVPPGPGPGTCAPHHGPTVTFANFIAELQATAVAAQWKNAPPALDADRLSTITAVNRGGEMHTFTRVANFGGGIVPELNTLSHNDTVAPECNELGNDDFVLPGGTYQATLQAHDKRVKFQCCIHPWMRTVVTVDQ